MSGLVIFDYDGTLCSTHGAIVFSLKEVFKERLSHELDVAQSTLMVGDTHVDLQFAKNFEFVAAWARYGYGNKAKCEAVGYDLVRDPDER